MCVRVQLRKGLTFRLVLTETTLLNPSAAINHPPAEDQQRQGERQVPPERQKDAHQHAQDGEEEPEDFLFHEKTLADRDIGTSEHRDTGTSTPEHHADCGDFDKVIGFMLDL